MFEKQTTFILGAGASWHYGYPTGDGLVKAAIAAARTLSKKCIIYSGEIKYVPSLMLEFDGKPIGAANYSAIIESWKNVQFACDKLAKGLETVNPPVIDYFLAQNPSLQTIGKFLVAWVILQCESEVVRSNGGNINRRHQLLSASPNDRNLINISHYKNYKDDWYRFVIHELLNCRDMKFSLLQNRVDFVTFNYDVSLENHFRHALSETEVIKQDEVDVFLETRVHHVYGRVKELTDAEYGELNFSTISQTDDLSDLRERIEFQKVMDRVYEASSTLKTIELVNKGENFEVLESARHAIQIADTVYILGYSFDERNNERLRLQDSLSVNSEGQSKTILFTNFEDSNRINKRAGQLLFDNYEVFLPSNLPIKIGRDRHYCEKSIRDTYGALELDFEKMGTDSK